MNTANGPARTTHTEEQSKRLLDLIQDSSRLLAELFERLKPVLRVEPTLPGDKAESVPEPYLVPLADTLRSLAKEIALNNNGLRGILDSLEL